MKQLGFIENDALNNINENIKEYVEDLLVLFPNSFINEEQEFIAVPRTNLYFLLSNCNSLLDIKCKILEWFSRDACKTQPFRSRMENEEYQDNIRVRINEFLGTDFTREEMTDIYSKLGNNINRKLCIEFIESGYNMKILKEQL